MASKLASIEVECECGCVHELFSMHVYFNDFDALIKELENEDLKVIRLFISEDIEKCERVVQIIKLLSDAGFEILKTIIKCNHAETIKANSIQYEGEEYILSIGNSNLFEMVKYYAYSVNVNFSLILNNEFYDYTFSKFARLYDGLNFNFYSCSAPQSIIFFNEDFKSVDYYKMILYFKAKNIVLFENLLTEKYETLNVCRKINSKIRKILKLSDKIIDVKDILHCCVFLGRAMSFFNCTKGFFGAEIEIANQLEIITKKNFIECFLMGSETLRRIYIAALNKNLSIHYFDINMRIDKIKILLSITATKCLTFIKKPKDGEVLDKQIKIACALKFKLLSFLEDFEITQTMSVSEKALSRAIYIAPEMTVRYTFLNLLRDLGYFERLV